MKAEITEGLTMMANMDYPYPTDIPLLISAELGTLANNIIVLTFDQVLNDTTLPAITCFTVNGAYLNAQVAVVAIVDDQVLLTLDNAARCDNVITLDYTVPPANGIRNINDTYAESFTGEAVTNNITVGYDDEPVVNPNGTSYLLVQNQLALSLKNSVEFEFWFYLSQFLITVDIEAICEVNNNATNWAKISIVPDNAGYGTNRKALRFVYNVNGVSSVKNFPNYFTSVPGWYKIKFVWSGTSLTVYKNDVLFSTIVVDNLNNMVQSVGCDLWLMRSVSGDVPIQSNNKLFGLKYKTNGTLICHYPICEESGNTVYNVVSNAYHLTGQSGFNALTWSRINDQEKYLRDYGYRLTGGVYIPGLLSGASAADGNPLTEWSPCTEFN